MIAILICVRVQGNPNSNLKRLLDSLQKHARRLDSFEVLIKFDDDDLLAADMIKNLHYPFAVKYCFGPRLRGYADIHRGYCLAYNLIDAKTTVVGAMADDFISIEPGWDQQILKAPTFWPDGIFIVHGRPHPWCDHSHWNSTRPFPKKEMYFIRSTNYRIPFDLFNYRRSKFNMGWDFNEIGNLYIVDEAPFWGRNLIDICGGFGPTYSTDAWTLALEHCLYNKHGIKRTFFTPREYIFRVVNPDIDQPGSPRWGTERQANFSFIRSDDFLNIVQEQAEKIAHKIKGSKPNKANFFPLWKRILGE